MAIRTIRSFGDECLRKNSKPVKEITPRIRELIQDLFDTMYQSGGVGLAAPQVGVLKRIFVIDTTREPEEGETISEEDIERFVMINPEILSTSGEQTGYEGCLSYAGYSGKVTRPDKVTVRFINENGDEMTLEAEGLLARCILHENDHLDGIIYTDHVEGKVYTNEELSQMLKEEEKK